MDDFYVLVPDSPIPRYSQVCTTCVHLLDYGRERKCKAFPNGIPDVIWLGENKHTEPYPGDSGIMYKMVEIEKKE